MNQRRHCADTWRVCVNRVLKHQHPPPIVIGRDPKHLAKKHRSRKKLSLSKNCFSVVKI